LAEVFIKGIHTLCQGKSALIAFNVNWFPKFLEGKIVENMMSIIVENPQIVRLT
jgi:hypothetical protein